MYFRLRTTLDNEGQGAFWKSTRLWAACGCFNLADANWQRKEPVGLILVGGGVFFGAKTPCGSVTWSAHRVLHVTVFFFFFSPPFHKCVRV